jgi:hypothetical protein
VMHNQNIWIWNSLIDNCEEERRQKEYQTLDMSTSCRVIKNKSEMIITYVTLVLIYCSHTPVYSPEVIIHRYLNCYYPTTKYSSVDITEFIRYLILIATYPHYHWEWILGKREQTKFLKICNINYPLIILRNHHHNFLEASHLFYIVKHVTHHGLGFSPYPESQLLFL